VHGALLHALTNTRFERSLKLLTDHEKLCFNVLNDRVLNSRLIVFVWITINRRRRPAILIGSVYKINTGLQAQVEDG